MGFCDHSCCTVGKWVFDIFSKKAMKNYKAKFDVICSDDRNPNNKITIGSLFVIFNHVSLKNYYPVCQIDLNV